MQQRTKCPMARTARRGDCEVPGCRHWSGTRRRICACCIQRMGTEKQAMYTLRLHNGDHDGFVKLEDECLAWLVAHPRVGSSPKYVGWARAPRRQVEP